MGEAVSNNIRITKSEGTFSHDLCLTNVSKVDYNQCEITLTVFYDNGKRPQIPRYWTSWTPREKKTINFPAEGRIERVDVRGTLTTQSGKKARLKATFEWKPR